MSGVAVSSRALAWVSDCLTSITPPGTPSPILTVVSAKFQKKDNLYAIVDMRDGTRKGVEIGKWSHKFEDAWRVQWFDTEQLKLSLEG